MTVITLSQPMTRQSLLKLFGTVAGSAVMYQAITQLALVDESGYSGPIKLSGDAKGASQPLQIRAKRWLGLMAP